MLTFHRTGNWPPGKISHTWSPNSRQLVPEVEAAIESAWTAALSRPGVHLFDGPMCRIEAWSTRGDELHLQLSPSSYKPFLGTNMTHPEFADRYGPRVMANPVGVSPALLSADGYLLLGRRNASVAYYPGRLHPFAGAMEPNDPDIFSAVRRELAEELSFTDSDIADIRCTGIAEDRSLRQPETIFAVTSTLSRRAIESRLDHTEHQGIWSIPATKEALTTALFLPSPSSARSTTYIGDELTPVALAALLLWARLSFGDDWFNDIRRAVLI